MKVTVERTPDSEAVLTVELDWDEIEAATNKAYKRLVQKYTVPGFRRGHAPRSSLERLLGKDTLYQEGLEDLIDESYQKAIKENDLTPIARPTVDAPTLTTGQPYTFSARVPILSPVALGDYKSIRVETPPVEVTDEEVQQTLERIQQDQAIWQPMERPAQLGDKLTVDLTLHVDDRQVSNLHDNEFELVEDRPGIFSGMDQHLIGLTEGAHAEFTTTIPEDYANTELAGKEATYDVTVKAVKARELPALDDELAKSIGDYETIDDVRKAVREQLKSQKETEARRKLREDAQKAATDLATVEIHPLLVEEEQDVMIRELKRTLEQNRISFNQYLAAMQKTEQEYRKEIEPEARERVKRDLTLDAIADAEHLEVSNAEVEQWVEILNILGGSGGRQIRYADLTPGQRANIEGSMRRDKAVGRLVEIATEGKGLPGDHDHDHDHDHGGEESAEAREASGAQSSDEADEAKDEADETDEAKDEASDEAASPDAEGEAR